MDIRVAAYGVIIRDDAILLSHWTAGRAWSLPGGGIDPGEDPMDAAIREIREETGYEASLGRLIGVDSKVIPASERLSKVGRPLHALRIVYEATIIGGDLRNEAEGSSDEARWIALSELPSFPRVALVDRGIKMLDA